MHCACTVPPQRVRHDGCIAGAKRAVRRGEVRVDGRAVTSTAATLLPGQHVDIVTRLAADGGRRHGGGDGDELLSEEEAEPGHAGGAPALRLRVLYEDDHVAVVFKPSGMPSTGSGAHTAAGQMKHCLRRSPALDAGMRYARPCHRLDAATCGLLLCAKTRPALTRLSQAFREQQVHKR